MEIKITKEDIETYILNYEDEGEVDVDTIWNDLKEIYTITTKPEEYVVKELLSHTIHKMNHKRKLVQRRKEQLKQLPKVALEKTLTTNFNTGHLSDETIRPSKNNDL